MVQRKPMCGRRRCSQASVKCRLYWHWNRRSRRVQAQANFLETIPGRLSLATFVLHIQGTVGSCRFRTWRFGQVSTLPLWERTAQARARWQSFWHASTTWIQDQSPLPVATCEALSSRAFGNRYATPRLPQSFSIQHLQVTFAWARQAPRTLNWRK